MTNEIVSRKVISFGKITMRISVFDDSSAMIVVDTSGLCAEIIGNHSDLVELRNALPEVLANGT